MICSNIQRSVIRQRISVNTESNTLTCFPGIPTGRHNLRMKAAGEILAEMMSERGFSHNELARRSGVPQPTITRIVNGSEPEIATLKKLAPALGVDVSLFLEHREAFLAEASVITRVVPIVGTTATGYDARWEASGYPAGFGNEYIENAPDPGAYALGVRDGFAPRFKVGEILIVSRLAQPNPGEDVVVKLTTGEVLVKQFVSARGDYLTVEDVNTNKRDMLDMTGVVYMHPVIGVLPASALRKR